MIHQHFIKQQRNAYNLLTDTCTLSFQYMLLISILVNLLHILSPICANTVVTRGRDRNNLSTKTIASSLLSSSILHNNGNIGSNSFHGNDDCSKNMLSRSRIFRIKQHWLHQLLGKDSIVNGSTRRRFDMTNNRRSDSSGKRQHKTYGTKLTWQTPTPDRVAKWFPSTSLASAIQQENGILYDDDNDDEEKEESSIYKDNTYENRYDNSIDRRMSLDGQSINQNYAHNKKRSYSIGVECVALVGQPLLLRNNLFNNPSVGMTNPTLHVTATTKNDDDNFSNDDDVLSRWLHKGANDILNSSPVVTVTSRRTISLHNHQLQHENNDNSNINYHHSDIKVTPVLSPRGSTPQKLYRKISALDNIGPNQSNNERRGVPTLKEAVLFPYYAITYKVRYNCRDIIIEDASSSPSSELRLESVPESYGTFQSSQSPNDGQSIDDHWWPSSSVSTGGTRSDNRWRIRRYRKRVGYGTHVYDACRDAALQWEFKSPSNDKGTMFIPDYASSVTSSLKTQIQNEKQRMTSSMKEHDDAKQQQEQPSIQQIWTGPGRRLATYTCLRNLSFLRIPKWIPTIHAINPVQIVYDVVDQRGLLSTYTSTAYGTLNGHALCGEERVTVCLRDIDNRVSIAETTGTTQALPNTPEALLRRIKVPIISFQNKEYQQPQQQQQHHIRQEQQQQPVDIEILSYSRPSKTIMGKLLWPIVSKFQDSFFVEQLHALERVATKAAATAASDAATSSSIIGNTVHQQHETAI